MTGRALTLGWTLLSVFGFVVAAVSLSDAMGDLVHTVNNGVVRQISRNTVRRQALSMLAQTLAFVAGVYFTVYPSPHPKASRVLVTNVTSLTLLAMQTVIVANSVLDLRATQRARRLARKTLLSEYAVSMVMETSDELIVVSDADGMFRLVSRSWEQLGYPRHVLEGTRWSDLVHPDDLQRTMAQHDRMQTGENATGFRNRYRRIDGSYVTLQWEMPRYNDDGLSFGRARIVHDERSR